MPVFKRGDDPHTTSADYIRKQYGHRTGSAMQVYAPRKGTWGGHILAFLIGCLVAFVLVIL